MNYLKELKTKYAWWFFSVIVWITCAFAQNSIAQEFNLGSADDKSRSEAFFSDSTWLLESVQVETSRLQHFSTGSQVFTFDSAQIRNQQALSMGELLANISPVYIKSYGAGSLSTSSFRGMGASHTAVLWNGMPLQSTMNGQLDFSLLPANLVDRAALQLGGEGALWGSGAVGGTLYLQNEPQFNSGIQANIAQVFGSFGKHFQSYSASYGSKDWFVSAKVFQSKAENDFTFNNRAKANTPRESMAHAAFRQRGILLENYVNFAKNQQLAFRFWGQENEREIPATLTENSSRATQDDRFARMLLTWTGYHKQIDWKLQSGYTTEELLFKDPDIQLESLSKSQTWINEAEANWQVNDWFLVQGGVQHQFLLGSNANYLDQVQNQHRASLLASVKYQDQASKLSARMSVRQEFAEYENAPLVPTLGVEYQPLTFLTVLAKLSRSYRLPTFNDLYWQPGGNSALQPEAGWSQEVGIQAQQDLAGLNSRLKLTAFSNKISNWILWRPGNGFWSPENVQQVWARGLEAAWELEKTLPRGKFNLLLRYHHTKSTIEKAYEANRSNEGNQLIYTPVHTGSANFTFKHDALKLTWQQQYNGQVYTTNSNTSALPGFMLANFLTSYTLKHKLVEVDLQAQIYNIANKTYEVMEWRPMPGRNYQFGIIIKPNFNI